MNTMNTMNTENTLDDILMAIYDRLDIALPEFEFERVRDGWRSKNAVKLDGRQGKTVGQVICTDNKPQLLADHSDKIYLTYWNYIQSRDNLDNSETFAKLLELAGIQAKPLTEQERANRRRMERSAEIWELFIDYTRESKEQYKNTDEYNVFSEYIKKRKYTLQDVTAMNLGWLNKDWPAAIEYIKSKSKYTTDEINETIQCARNVIGYSHQLIIPLRNRSGRIEGIAARNMTWKPEDNNPKYLYNKGLEKRNLLTGLPYKTKRVLIVEGPLDAGICAARGYNGAVAALGGKDATIQQVQQLLAAGVQTVDICLDNEPATIKAKSNLIDLILQTDQDNQISDRIFLVQLPDGIKDVDELLTTMPDGLEQLNDAVNKAAQYYKWNVMQVVDKYNETEMHDRHMDEMLEGIVRIGAKIKTPTSREALIKNVTETIEESTHRQDMAEAFEKAIEQIKRKDDEQQQQQQLNRMLKKANTLEPADAIEYIKNEIRSVETRNLHAEFEKLYNYRLNEAELLRRGKEKPAAIQIGFKMQMDGNDEPENLEVPAGQLTFFAAKTGHGKTKFLLNVALNIINSQPEKTVHFFTYEIDDMGVMQFALNIFIGEPISKNNRKSLRSYVSKNTTEYITHKALFEKKKQLFFDKYIDNGRLQIHHTEYSANELVKYFEWIRKQNKNAVIIVDYVQKLRSDRKGNIDNRHTELKFVCEDMNACAIRTGLPILMAAQYVRQLETPLDVAPQKLAEASDIEKISSEIYSVWDCWPYLPGDVMGNSKIIKEINKRYGFDFTDENRNKHTIILELIKSRLYGTGHHTLLEYDRQSGRISQANTTIEPKRKKSLFTDN